MSDASAQSANYGGASGDEISRVAIWEGLDMDTHSHDPQGHFDMRRYYLVVSRGIGHLTGYRKMDVPRRSKKHL